MKTTSTRILVSIDKQEETITNELGLRIPSPNFNEGIEKAEVMSVGSDVIDVKPGDTCFIYEGAGKEFTNPEDQKKYRVITVADIVVIF